MRFLKLTTPKDIVISELTKAGLGVIPARDVAKNMGINEGRLGYLCKHHCISLASQVKLWSKEETNRLMSLRDSGLSFPEISKLLGRTEFACRKKYGKQKLRRR